ncbi:MAG: penicillin acylase family protein, partial [Flavisolibacter sp.]|nr:penicillin acylase family protein [Flavisolibacter sp.]
PQEQNPHILNPTSGFIQSANQMPVDSAYPYFIPGHYFVPRGVTIANRLTQMQQITPQDMMLLQNDTHSSIAADAVPLLLRNLYEQNFSDKENYYLNMLKKWDYTYTPETQAPTVYQAWIDSLKSIIWKDEFAQIKGPKTLPDEQTLVEWLLRDTAMKFIDDIRTPEKETLPQQVTKAFRLAITGLNKEVNENELIWWKHKNTSIYHLLRTAVLPFARTGIEVGGWSTVINATTAIRGPSWRMIVHMTQPTEAYGVYPGGQSGNPGSRFYESFIDTWATGKYYTLWMMKENEAKDKRVKWKMTFTNA